MSYPGHVRNGSVVLDSPLPLPDGTAVRVEAVPAPLPKNLKRYGEDGSLTKTPAERLAAVMAEQGHKNATFESLLGAGEDWWESDEEFDRFLAFLRDVRRD